MTFDVPTRPGVGGGSLPNDGWRIAETNPANTTLRFNSSDISKDASPRPRLTVVSRSRTPD